MAEKVVDNKSKEEGKDQELIQSSTTPDPEHHIWESDKNTRKHHIPEISNFIPDKHFQTAVG